MKRISAMQQLAILILIAGLSGCSLLSDGFDEITVANAMDKPLYFFGVEEEFSYRLDLQIKIPVGEVSPEEGIFLLEPGATETLQTVDIHGEYNTGKILQLYLYEVRGDTAYANGHLEFTYDELEQKDFRIEVSDFPQY